MGYKEMLKYIEQSDKIIISGGYQSSVDYNWNRSIIYFKGVVSYRQFSIEKGEEHYSTELIEYLKTIVRIERMFDGEFYPIWTNEDGIISQTEKFVRLNGKYYTIKFLEQLIDKIKEIKDLNI